MKTRWYTDETGRKRPVVVMEERGEFALVDDGLSKMEVRMDELSEDAELSAGMDALMGADFGNSPLMDGLMSVDPQTPKTMMASLLREDPASAAVVALILEEAVRVLVASNGDHSSVYDTVVEVFSMGRLVEQILSKG